MRIKSVHFEAFKSLYDFTAELGDLTVLTGANGSGKSNLVDGLVFIGNAYLHGLELAVSHGGGYENLAHRRTRRARRPIRIKVDVDMTAEEAENALRYSMGRRKSIPKNGEKRASTAPLRVSHDFSFKAVSQQLTADFEVVDESLSILTPEGETVATIRRQRDASFTIRRFEVPSNLEEVVDDLLLAYEEGGYLSDIRHEPSDLVIAKSFYIDAFWHVARYLASIRVFQLSPQTSRLAGVASPRAQLERHGDNLPGAADYLRRNHLEEWTKIESAMRTIIPTLEEISIAYTEDRRLAVQFREKGVGRAWNSSEVSDGTIQAFALLVAVYDPRASILVIEELENALHPWILRQILRICQESPRQLLLTSHSPVLLTSVPPESVKLMWMTDGRSSIADITAMDDEMSSELLAGEITIFELLDSGAVSEAIPRGFA